jgi:hypothetical protein
MNKTLSKILLVIAVLGGIAVLGLSGSAVGATNPVTEGIDVACEQAGGSAENLAGEIFLLAQVDKKFKCLEKCSDNRYNCEKVNKDKNKPGTKQNWDESSKCEVKYDDCRNKCE